MPNNPEATQSQFLPLEPGTEIALVSASGDRVVQVDLPEVVQVADLVSRLNDMREVIRYCDQFLEFLKTPDTPEIVMEALWRAGLVSYGRAFANDIRKHGQLKLAALDLLPGVPREVHRYLLFLRNKFVAHSDNSLEDSKVGVVLSSPPAAPAVLDVVSTYVSAYGFIEEGATSMRQLADAFATWASNEADRLRRKILADALELDLNTLYANPNVTYRMPAANDAGESRQHL